MSGLVPILVVDDEFWSLEAIRRFLPGESGGHVAVDGPDPVNVQHIARSLDSCMVCTVH